MQPTHHLISSNKLLLWAVALTAMFVGSCNYAKYLPKGETLYTGSSVIITDKDAKNKDKQVLKQDLEGVISPKPNSKFLGIRLKLWIYNIVDTPKKENSFRAKLRNNLGEPPVLGSTFDEEKNRLLMLNVLENRGYFRASIFAERIIKDHDSRGLFQVTTRAQSIIDSVEFVQDNTLLAHEIFLSSEKTLLKKGQPYNLELIKGERERIDKHLKERGYYYFRPDYLIVLTDTTIGNSRVWMKVAVKKDQIQDLALRRYRIHNVTVYPNYTLNEAVQDTLQINGDTLDGFTVIQDEKKYKPSLFVNAMLFKPGELYNKTDQNSSIARIINLSTFKFAKNRFEVVPDTITPLLNVYYYLTPAPKKTLTGDLGASTRSDSKVGSDISISWINRNAFKGAEQWTIKAYAGFETQYGGDPQTKRPSTYRDGIETSLTFPKFLVPFFKVPLNSQFTPITELKIGYENERRIKAYTINSFKTSFGYKWKEEIRKDHALNLININYVKTDSLTNDSSLYNFNYSNLVFNGLIIGPTYEYTFNSQSAIVRTNNYYFDGQIDLSNNLLGLIQKANYQTNPEKILGVPYAQYVKLFADGRYYYRMSPTNDNMIANRLNIGWGLPYGNSSALPNIKQFFSGGNSSLRGFRSRLVGPGTYNELYLYPNKDVRSYIETLGDIKLEFNSEVRFGIYKFIKGACFFDAGNIWLRNENPNFPGGKFTKNFYKEFAADLGLGLRFDFNVIMLRFDVGMPVRKPWLPAGERWVFNQINFGDGHWRANNLILNIAIGQPF